MRAIDPRITDIAAEQDSLVRLDQITPMGIVRDSLHGDVDSGRARRLHRGVYLIGRDVAVSDRQRLLAAHLHLGPDAIMILRSALYLHGIEGVVGPHVPQVALPPGQEKRQRPNVDIHFWRIPDEHLTTVDGLPVTTIARTLADSTRLLPRLQAVSCLDSALNLGLVTPDDLPAVAELMSRHRQCRAGRQRLADARVGAQSPLETRVRLRAADGGFPPDALQVPITTVDGVLLGYGDMGYRLPGGTWLVVEADGRRVHELPEAVLHDRRRQNSFLAVADARIVRFTWSDTDSAGYIPSVLRPALVRAGWDRPRRP